MNESLTLSTLLRALGNEIRKSLRVAWAERMQILIELPMFVLFALMLGPVIGAGHQILHGHLSWSLSSSRTSTLVLWFVPFTFYYMQVVKMFWRLLGEIQTGTLEQAFLSPLPTWVIAAAGRVLAAILESAAVAAGNYGLVDLFVRLHYHWTPAALLPVVLLVVSGTGVSLLVAGLTLVYKRIQQVNDTLLAIVTVASVGALPIMTTPGWLQGIGKFIPLTANVGSLYGVMLGHRGVLGLWGTSGVIWMVTIAAFYMALGVIAFWIFERVAKTRGTLIRY